MKIALSLLICTLIFVCKPSKQIIVNEIADTTISKSELSDIIDTISSDRYEGRETGTVGINKAAIYIENFLKNQNIKPFFKQFLDSFDVYDKIAFNIIGLIEGTDPVLKKEYIILSAHYDHLGKKFGRKDSVYNGANDNASGVSTVLNIAKIIAENKSNKRSIIVALFSSEELGLNGSEHFADTISKLSFQAYCGINIDMIGSILSNQPGKVYITGYEKSNMAKVFNQHIGNESVVLWKTEALYGLFGASDNYPIYQKLNIPAHTFCTFDFMNYAYYHELTDEIAKINMDNAVLIANNICRAIIKIANSDKKEIKLND
jgi:leucyl aminopeptidase